MVKYLDAVIRNLQRTKGHVACFNTMKKNCEEVNCRWYRLCQEECQDFYLEEVRAEQPGFDYKAA